MNKLLMSLSLLLSLSLSAAEHEVKLLTSVENGETMVMSPGFIKIAKGDTIKFIPSDVTHNAESLVSPAAAKPFVTPMGKITTITFSEEGVYLYKCTPHFALGMLGVVQVGKAINKDDVITKWQSVKAHVFANKERVDNYLSQVN